MLLNFKIEIKGGATIINTIRQLKIVRSSVMMLLSYFIIDIIVNGSVYNDHEGSPQRLRLTLCTHDNYYQ